MTKEEKLLGFLKSADYRPMKADEIKICLNVKKCDEEFFYETLDNMVKNGQIMKNKKGMYKAYGENCKNGKIHLVKTGGFVLCSDGEEIFVKLCDLNGAFENDEVTVKVVKEADSEKCSEGVVLKILKRGMKSIVGKFTNIYGICGFTPFDMRLPVERYIMLKDNTKDLKNGDMIEASIVNYPRDGSAMTVKFKEKIVLDKEISADTGCLIKIFDIPDKFSKETLLYAKEISSEAGESEIKKRRDFRNDKVITIDGEDARDLDDAVCVKKYDNFYRLSVHIADVSHYVKFNSPIDMDARKRATSVYFPDRVVPMLPVELSNGICSLNPNVNRLTLSVIMDIDKEGEFLNYEIVKGVICSCERMTYKTVTALLENNADEDTKKRYSHISEELKTMRELALVLKKRRINQGYIGFDVPEVKFSLDENGKAVDVFRYETGISNEIIEQFMLMANEAVAKFGEEHKLPFIYRIHEKPSGDKEKNLRDILHFYSLHIAGEITPVSVADAVSQLSENEDFYAISAYLLRCMMKARYDTENLGHFGLGCENYLHFTSPIRRYPDLQVHRVISYYLDKTLKGKVLEQMEGFSGQAAVFSTEAELRAAEAEREADKLKACEYMQKFVGNEFEAVISSVTDFGLFITLENAVEGFIPIAELADDYYIFEKENYRLKGSRSGKSFALGDRIKAKLEFVDVGLRRIDFSPIGLKSDKSVVNKKTKIGRAEKILHDKKRSGIKKRQSRKNALKHRRNK